MASRVAHSRGSLMGIAGCSLGIIASAILLFVPLSMYSSGASGGGTTTGWGAAGIGYLLGSPDADPAIFFWAVVVLCLSVVGGYGAVTERRSLVLAIAVVLLGLTIVGLLSIGLFVAPAAIAFLVSGLWIHSEDE